MPPANRDDARRRRLAPTNPHVAAAIDFIRATDTRKLSVESVAKACGTSHSYLSKNFKRETHPCQGIRFADSLRLGDTHLLGLQLPT